MSIEHDDNNNKTHETVSVTLHYTNDEFKRLLQNSAIYTAAENNVISEKSKMDKSERLQVVKIIWNKFIIMAIFIIALLYYLKYDHEQAQLNKINYTNIKNTIRNEDLAMTYSSLEVLSFRKLEQHQATSCKYQKPASLEDYDLARADTIADAAKGLILIRSVYDENVQGAFAAITDLASRTDISVICGNYSVYRIYDDKMRTLQNNAHKLMLKAKQNNLAKLKKIGDIEPISYAIIPKLL